jgi:hypothetical protein
VAQRADAQRLVRAEAKLKRAPSSRAPTRWMSGLSACCAETVSVAFAQPVSMQSCNCLSVNTLYGMHPALAADAVAGIKCLTQRLARPRQARAHCAQRHVEDRGCLLVPPALKRDEQQQFPVLLAQAQIRVAHLGQRDAGFLGARDGQRRPARRELVVDRDDPLVAADLVDMAIAQDDAQPRAYVCSGLPRIHLCDRARQAFLNQIIGVIGLAAEVSGIPPQQFFRKVY